MLCVLKRGVDGRQINRSNLHLCITLLADRIKNQLFVYLKVPAIFKDLRIRLPPRHSIPSVVTPLKRIENLEIKSFTNTPV